MEQKQKNTSVKKKICRLNLILQNAAEFLHVNF